jgi:hypothetical protein
MQLSGLTATGTNGVACISRYGDGRRRPGRWKINLARRKEHRLVGQPPVVPRSANESRSSSGVLAPRRSELGSTWMFCGRGEQGGGGVVRGEAGQGAAGVGPEQRRDPAAGAWPWWARCKGMHPPAGAPGGGGGRAQKLDGGSSWGIDGGSSCRLGGGSTRGGARVCRGVGDDLVVGNVVTGLLIFLRQT